MQVAPDTQTALALVSAEVGCHLTLASVADNVTDPHVVFIPLDESTPSLDVALAGGVAHVTIKTPRFAAVLDELLTLNDLAGAEPRLMAGHSESSPASSPSCRSRRYSVVRPMPSRAAASDLLPPAASSALMMASRSAASISVRCTPRWGLLQMLAEDADARSPSRVPGSPAR